MRKLFRQIHLWLSVPFGLIIALVCFSGAMLVFENEVNELLRPELYQVKKTESSPLPVEHLLNKVAATLPDGVSVTGITIPSDPRRTYQVSLSNPRGTSVFVDPYSGEIKGKGGRSGFFLTMFRLHRWLLDSMPVGNRDTHSENKGAHSENQSIFWGRIVVGVSTLLFVFVLLSGLVIWWPRTRKALKKSLKISAAKGWRRFCYDLHIAGGIYAFLLLLVMALTGLTWSFPWYKTAFYKLFGVEVEATAGFGHMNHGQTAQGKGAGHKAQSFANWQKVYEKLSRQTPEYRQISLSSGTARVYFHCLGNQRASDRYHFDPDSGEFTQTSLYQHVGKEGKIRGWIYSVHVGNWGGWLTRILTFIAALIGAALPLTGYYLWIKKLMNKRKRKIKQE